MSPPGARLPVTIISGFLGSGKTTLLRSLLAQARRTPDARLGVIVNEMSALDVDSAVLDASEVISRRDARFASIPAGSISGEEGLALFAAAVERLKDGGAAHILVETSGGAHPWPLLQAVRAHPAVRLHGFVSVVDALTLAQDHDLGRAVKPAASRHLAAGRRGMENLLAEQIMFANLILLSKMDRVSAQALRDVAESAHALNPGADIMGMQWGNLGLAKLLALPGYDYDRVATLGAELTELDRRASGCQIGSVVIADARPFHPRRLWEVYTRHLGVGIYRSKGFFWLPTRDHLQLLWNQTAGNIALEIVNYWKIAALEDASLNLSPEERRELKRRLEGMSPDFGDRRCRLTVIGDRGGVDEFASAVRRCFCTADEVAAWKAGERFDDPWPKTTVTLATP